MVTQFGNFILKNILFQKLSSKAIVKGKRNEKHTSGSSFSSTLACAFKAYFIIKQRTQKKMQILNKQHE